MKYLSIISMILLLQNRISAQDLTFTEIRNAVLDNGKHVHQSNESRLINYSFDWSNFQKTLLNKRFVYVETKEFSRDEIWAYNYNIESKTASIWINLKSDFFGTDSSPVYYKGIEMTFSENDFNYNNLEDKIKQYCAFKKVAFSDIDNSYRRIYLHPDGLVFTLLTDIKNNTNHIYTSLSKENHVNK